MKTLIMLVFLLVPSLACADVLIDVPFKATEEQMFFLFAGLQIGNTCTAEYVDAASQSCVDKEAFMKACTERELARLIPQYIPKKKKKKGIEI